MSAADDQNLGELVARKDYHHEPWHSVGGRSLRNIIFGVNDGLITAFGFVSGVSGAHIAFIIVFLTGIAQALAGAVSMCFGAYLSNKAEQEFFRGEISRERNEIDSDPKKETDEIREIYESRGFTPEEIEILVKRITSDKRRWLSFMMTEELGIVAENFDSPWKGAFAIGVSFFVGAIVPVFPYLFASLGVKAMYLSAALTFISLFLVGVGKTRFTKTSWLSGGFEMLIIGAVAGGLGYGVGRLMSLFGLGAA